MMKNRTTNFVLAQMRTIGATLHTSHEGGRTSWFLSNDRRPLADGVGVKVSRDLHIVSVGDCLFADGLAQTYRYTFTRGE
jgi:hypothetical protein